jgi:alkylation response protein AidB-like acyl-CoA dehydrogenase
MTKGRSPDEFVYRDTEAMTARRARLRGLMADHLPEGWLGPFTDDPADLEISNRFCEVLAEEGLFVPDWPREYGGEDADLASSVATREEMWANFEPRGGQYYGPNWLGPSIFHYGTEAQKALHLPRIAAGKALWCQGFSEPDAGSDLTNLKTRAVPDGDGYRITGQKTWTSWALWADWCYLLARVDGFGDDRHAGITVFLLPMDREGITVRGLDGIPGPHHLNEVFLDGVWAEPGEVLGEVGRGWQVIRDALSNERVGIARYARADRLVADVLTDDSLASALPPSRWLPARVRNRMSRLMCRRALWFQELGGSDDFIVSAARMVTTRADQLVADVIGEAMGDRFFEHRDTAGAALGGAHEFYWRYMQAATIASGTTEMLQRTLAKVLLRGERTRVTDGVEEVREAVDRLLAARGGVGAARDAVARPETRAALLGRVEGIIDSLDPRAGLFEGKAAAEVCRGAGFGALPLPVEAMLLRRPSGAPLSLVSPGGRFEHGDLFAVWELATLDGAVGTAPAAADLIGSKVGPFVNRTPVTISAPADPLTDAERALLLVLPSWYVLGALEQALDLAANYANERVAFGQPIASYQAVAFPLADASSELQALYELALQALVSVYESPHDARVDALALRWAAQDVARRVLRTCHQVLGAVGLCDEHDLTIVTLTLQARLRLPLDLEATLDALAAAVAEDGFDSLYTPTAATVRA